MRAAIRRRYGPPEVLEIVESEKPDVADDGVLVRVRAVSINRADWYLISGTPYVGRPMMGLRTPKTPSVGSDFSGVVEDVGRNVTDFTIGDAVFGCRGGAFADYVSVETGVAHKPAHVSFEEAAAVPVPGLTALQGLRDKAGLTAGRRVLVNGASGGVGTSAIQIAKALGGHVTAVCSTRNLEQARTLGADEVVDYTKEEFTRGAERYDVLFDIAGTRSWSECRRVLAPEATVVLVGGRSGRLLGPLGHAAAMKLASVPGHRRAAFFIAQATRTDMDALGDLLETRRLTPVVEATYDFADIARAVRHVGEGHARAKVVVRL